MDSAGSTRSSNRPVSRRGGGGVGNSGGETMADSPLKFRPVTRGGMFNLPKVFDAFEINRCVIYEVISSNLPIVKLQLLNLGARPPSSLRNGTASRLTSSLGGGPTTTRLGTAIGNVGNVKI